VDPVALAGDLLHAANRVIIIPGYGMALAEASDEVVQLGERLTEMGKEVIFAIHPVAGRMPGHMHVLLAEAEVDYGRLRELKDVNGLFPETDVALIVGGEAKWRDLRASITGVTAPEPDDAGAVPDELLQPPAEHDHDHDHDHDDTHEHDHE